ncbi:serine hydrolase [Streptosporangiaceae bacterium NEAU-GS5]|nr:serine hydrolase [Streptosporangiaceae bacterium NEAU-GS5]
MRSRKPVAVGACVVPMLSLLALTGCAETAAVDCDRIAGDGRRFYESNPTYTDPRDDDSKDDDPERSPPERQGMSSATLHAGLTELARNPSLLSVLVIRHGHLVAERYFHGGGERRSDNVHSASKSILQALVHIAVAEGFIKSLDDPVAAYLPRYFSDARPDKKKITIRHLLTMRSGLDWTEDSTESQVEKAPDWVAAILGRPLVSAPGTTYNYSSGDTHVVSAVLQQATGMSTCRFAHRYLFGPMGVTAEHWGRDPQGVFSGGYNLYLTPRELARFGLLYLHDGIWAGRRLVPRGAVRAARTRTTQVDDTSSYSEGWWTRVISGRPMYFAWGYGGQFVHVIPSADIVLVTTENTSDDNVNEEIDPEAFIRDRLLPAITGP